MKNRKMIIPAIIARTQKELDEKLNKVDGYAELVQLDIMDGRFVPNISCILILIYQGEISNSRLI